MNEFRFSINELKDYRIDLRCGDRLLLSGKVYTARDAAHMRMFQEMESDALLPISVEDAVIYYAGPTPTPKNLAIGSCGPTTSSRMDPFAPALYDMGMLASIGKGDRSEAVYDAIRRNRGVYLCAIGGAGALASQCIRSCHMIAYDDLGCESIKELIFDDFPLIVAIDSRGNSIFHK